MNEHEDKKWQSIFKNFLDKPEEIYQADIATLQDLMQAAFMVLNDSISDILKNQTVTIMYEITFSKKFTLEECWSIYWILMGKIFSDSKVKLLKGSLRKLYDNIFDSVKKDVNINFIYHNINSRDQKHVIIIANQILSDKHAPTRRILDYSYAIQKYLGKKVTIINSSELHYHRIEALNESTIFNYVDAYSDYSAIDYLDEQFGFYQVDILMPNLEVYKKLIEIIYELNPLLIYNIGGSNILADLCTQFTTTVSLPCSYGIPITRSKYLLVGRKMEESDKEKLNELELYQSVIETEMNFVDSPDEVVYKRSDFNLQDEDFIACVVGNRLEAEIDTRFLDFLKDILSFDRLHVVLIGNIQNHQQIMKGISDESVQKMHFLGQQKHAKAIIKLSNLYLNPERNGGGRSSFEALSAGVPVVTLAFGDVHYVCSEEFSVENYEEMYSTVINYYNDAEFNSSMKSLALSRASRLSDIVTTQKFMMEKVLELESKNG